MSRNARCKNVVRAGKAPRQGGMETALLDRSLSFTSSSTPSQTRSPSPAPAKSPSTSELPHFSQSSSSSSSTPSLRSLAAAIVNRSRSPIIPLLFSSSPTPSQRSRSPSPAISPPPSASLNRTRSPSPLSFHRRLTPDRHLVNPRSCIKHRKYCEQCTCEEDLSTSSCTALRFQFHETLSNETLEMMREQRIEYESATFKQNQIGKFYVLVRVIKKFEDFNEDGDSIKFVRPYYVCEYRDLEVTRGKRGKKGEKGIPGTKEASTEIYKGLFSADNLKKGHPKLWEMQQKIESTNLSE